LAQASDPTCACIGHGCDAASCGDGYWCMTHALLLLFLVCRCVALVNMPHLHRPEKLAVRRARALQRGFIRPRPPGCSFVEVSTHLAPRIRTMAKSVATHAAHNALLDRPEHFARHAALAAAGSGLIDLPAARAALADHRAANRAKHHWAPPARISCWADADNSSDSSSLRAALPVADPWTEGSDPWALALRSLPSSPPCGARCSPPPAGGAAAADGCLVLVDAPSLASETRRLESVLNPDAPPWLGDQPCSVRVTATCGPPTLPSWQGAEDSRHAAELGASSILEEVIHTQNATIALLCGRLETTQLSSSPPCAAPTGCLAMADCSDLRSELDLLRAQALAAARHADDTTRQVVALAASLSESVQAKVSELSDIKFAKLSSDLSGQLEANALATQSIVSSHVDSLALKLRSLQRPQLDQAQLEVMRGLIASEFNARSLDAHNAALCDPTAGTGTCTSSASSSSTPTSSTGSASAVLRRVARPH